METEPYPDDPRQTPHPESHKWNSPAWRKRWLAGMTDEQLSAMSPADKAYLLPAYVTRNGYQMYGETAHHYILGSRFIYEAGLPKELIQDHAVKIGKTLSKKGKA